MTTNFTTLALNILISERLDYRHVFADRMLELLQEQNAELKNDKVLINNFITLVTKCVADPNCEERDVFYQLAQYYTEKMNKNSDLSAVA